MRAPALPNNYLASGAELDARVAALRAAHAAEYSRVGGTAWRELWTEIENHAVCGVMVQRCLRFEGNIYECAIVYSASEQTHATCINGFSDTLEGAVCAAYVRLGESKVEGALKKKRAPERYEGATVRVPGLGKVKFEGPEHALPGHEYDEKEVA